MCYSEPSKCFLADNILLALILYMFEGKMHV